MANKCYIDIIIETYNKEDADKIDAVLSKRYFEAHTEQKGMFIGSQHRYLFEPTMERQNDTALRIEGWVKWSIDYEEAFDIIDWLTVINTSYISIRYEEIGFYLYGEYVYDDRTKTLKDIYVAKDDFPEYEGNDMFWEELEEVFQQKGVDILVYDYSDKVQNNPETEKGAVNQ